MKTLPVLLADFYKTCHAEQYDPKITKVVSYYVPRKSRLYNMNNVVFFGLQAFIGEYLVKYFNENFFDRSIKDIISEYEDVLEQTMGPNRCHSEKIINLHKLGYLPIEIKALPEGTMVPIGTPMIEISNTHPDFAWCTNFIETLMLSELWYTMCVATTSKEYRDIANKWFEKTSYISARNAISEFGFRSLPGLHAAIKASSGFMLSFQKSSNIPAIQYVSEHYETKLKDVGGGMASTEHSVMCSSAVIDGNEKDLIKRLLTKVYPDGNFSMVCDSFDYWNIVDHILPELKTEILNRKGTLFVRGDSGDPINIVTQTVFHLWSTFGGTTNEKGYKVLVPQVRAIYGDSITQARADKIYSVLEAHGFSAENVALGAGGFSMLCYELDGDLCPLTRDTFNVAIKCTYVEYNDKPIPVYKNPKTDSGMKKSHKGCCAVIKSDDTLKCIDGLTFADTNLSINWLKPVFRNGNFLSLTNLKQVRHNLWGGKF